MNTKLISWLLPFTVLMQSCTESSKDGLTLTQGLIMTAFIFVLIVVIGYFLSSGSKPERSSLEKYDVDDALFIKSGKYIGGHPAIDNIIESASLLPNNSVFEIYSTIWAFNILAERPKKLGSIPFDSIKNITIEDSSSIEKRVTLGRVLLIGIFALAWKKNKKKENAFLAIEWNDGRFDHTTLFTFENNEAFQQANLVRNKIIKLLQPSF